MNESEASKIVHAYLCENISLEKCKNIPSELYESNPDDEYLFSFKLLGRSNIGSSEYIAVSITTGSVRYLGFHGE
jgi:hypothetical protein